MPQSKPSSDFRLLRFPQRFLNEKQRARLERGCCPVHGIWMSQVGGPEYDDGGVEYVVVGCPRRACSIIAKAYSFDGPWIVFPESMGRQ